MPYFRVSPLLDLTLDLCAQDLGPSEMFSFILFGAGSCFNWVRSGFV